MDEQPTRARPDRVVPMLTALTVLPGVALALFLGARFGGLVFGMLHGFVADPP